MNHKFYSKSLPAQVDIKGSILCGSPLWFTLYQFTDHPVSVCRIPVQIVLISEIGLEDLLQRIQQQLQTQLRVVLHLYCSSQNTFIFLQGVPINMGNSVIALISSSIHFFMNTIISEFQLKLLIQKTLGLEIFKTWSTIFVFSKLTEKLQNVYKVQSI